MFKITSSSSFLVLLLTALSVAQVSFAARDMANWRRQHQAAARSVHADPDYNATEILDTRAPRGSSRWTWYNTETGNAGSCGRFLKNTEFVVARAAVDMNQKRDCGKKITLSYGGKTAVAIIEDTCPDCPPNALDLSRELFRFFSPLGAGIIYGEWEFGTGGGGGGSSSTTTTTTSTSTTTTRSSTTTTTTSSKPTTTRTSTTTTTTTTPTTTRTSTTTTTTSTPTPTTTPTTTSTPSTTSTPTTTTTTSSAPAATTSRSVRRCRRRETLPTAA